MQASWYRAVSLTTELSSHTSQQLKILTVFVLVFFFILTAYYYINSIKLNPTPRKSYRHINSTFSHLKSQAQQKKGRYWHL